MHGRGTKMVGCMLEAPRGCILVIPRGNMLPAQGGAAWLDHEACIGFKKRAWKGA